ncbi:MULTISPECIES: YetF domain-containing protein [unclassified Arthrobacter]|uniref:DUF421 domain-containing protein n=1 Tax=unclassified Arthrobacter TaxID=235627 RepID=UPI0021051F90|nr:DUF421 domain-containing protein [Arthrobacter sp. zg-Y1116]MCQ1987624.1 DUF421 domain-containing protein [Arthrobacter sp. zg-Y844]
MWHNLGITPSEALWVVLSALGIYAAFSLLVRGLGQRALASWSTLDRAIVIALGGVLGRVVLGYTPTLAAGVIGLATMFGMLRLEGYLRRSRHGAYLSSRPILLMAGSEVVQEGLQKAHILEEELFFKLRQSGIRNLTEVAAAILEPTGEVSVLRRGELIAPQLLLRVTNASRIPRELVLPE